MEDLAPLLVALLVGLLIGLDRERAEVRKDRPLFAGVRTFPLIALAGALPVLLREELGAGLLLVSFLAVAGVVVTAYVRGDASHPGATTEIAALVTFLLGALAGAGQLGLAAAAGVTVAVLLAAKPPLERLSRALSAEEMYAVLELAVISVIVLPILPDRGYGPWQTLNPRSIWTIVVLVSALSFAGFVAVRLLGERRGALVTGALGGLVSSTAVTIAMAERSRDRGAEGTAAAAAVVASTIMCLRVGVLAGVVSAGLLPRLLPVVATMAVVGLGAAALLTRGSRGRSAPASTVRNPFSLASALAFAAVYAAVLVLVRAAGEYLGDRGLYATAVLSGAVDVDAPTIAFARLDVVDTRVPVAAITIAAVTNTLVKLGLGVAFGADRFRLQLAAALGLMALGGAVAGWLALGAA